MSWYNTEGPCSDYVLFSKVRYIRNFATTPFYKNIDAKASADHIKRIDALLTQNGFHSEQFGPCTAASLLSLAEKQFVDPDFLPSSDEASSARSVYLNEPCNLIVALGGKNSVSVSSLTSGLSVTEAKNIASGAEELLDREMEFAYSDRLGYLSPSVSLCGSGSMLSAAVFLPSIRLEKNFEKYRRALSGRRISLSPLFSGENAGDIFILSFVPSHLADETASAVFFYDTVKKIFEEESSRLRMLFPEAGRITEETAYRALGTLLYSRRLSENELMSLLSSIRLCLCLAKDKSNDTLPCISKLNYLIAEAQECNVFVSSKEKLSSQDDCDRARSDMVKKYIEH